MSAGFWRRLLGRGPITTAADIDALGYSHSKWLKTKREWAGVRQVADEGKLVVGITPTAWRVRFTYPSMRKASAALAAWDDDGDPPGDWINEEPGNRRGPGWRRGGDQ